MRAPITEENTAAGAGPDGSARWPLAATSLVVGLLFLALWFWLLPPALGFRVEAMGSVGWRWVGVMPAVLGFAAALRCVWNFGWTGHGTPAPVVPPKKLVVVGFYRHVRNPMYLGFFVGWAGLWLVFGRVSWAAIAVASGGVFATACFVRLYEEPTLRRLFGAECEDYCRNVRRWVPRLRAWTQ